MNNPIDREQDKKEYFLFFVLKYSVLLYCKF
jgi:hypothetical protein